MALTFEAVAENPPAVVQELDRILVEQWPAIAEHGRVVAITTSHAFILSRDGQGMWLAYGRDGQTGALVLADPWTSERVWTSLDVAMALWRPRP
jgi:hypothetical protein